jgi:thymidylate synthase
MNNIDKKYQELLQDILDNGIEKKDRTGTGTISVFGRQIRHKMSEGFPLLTTKKMAWKTMVTELLWFLQGSTNIKFLVDNGCHIWDGDAYKNYCKHFMDEYLEKNELGEFYRNSLRPYPIEEFINKIKTDDEFAKKWGELGPIYGKQWRGWTKKKMYLSTDGSYENIYDEVNQTVIDQISILINDLKTNPDSRRLMVNAWNVGELDSMVLPPCHYGFQVYTRELSEQERMDLYNKSNWNKDIFPSDVSGWNRLLDTYNIPTRAISLMWNQRSVDTFLGLPFNIASYGLLLLMLADEVNMVPDELIGNLGDTHIYLNHIEQAKEQIGRELTDEERYNIWFNNNYETGMERYFDPNNLPDFDNEYYVPTPKRTREPFELPTVHVRDGIFCSSISDVILENYQAHPTIKAPLSN